MTDQQRSYNDLIAENERLQAKLDSMGFEGKTKPLSADNTADMEKRIKSCILELMNLSYAELYPFIIKKAVELFNLKAAVISVYEEETSELSVKYTSLSEKNSLLISKLIGSDITTLKIPLTKKQHNFLISTPFHQISDPHKLTFGLIPETTAEKITLDLDFGWYICSGLIYKDKLFGTIALAGAMDQSLPDKEMLNFYFGITANTLGSKAGEEALWLSETRFRQLFNEAPICYHSLDKEGHFIDINQAWSNLSGYSREEVIGRWIGDFLSDKSKSVFPETFRLFKEHGKIKGELELVTKDQKVLILESEGRIGYDPGGNFRQTHCILKDITEQRKAEKLIKEREDVFEAIANYTANWESWFDNSGKIIWTNPASYRFTGYSPDEILAFPDYINTLVDKPDRERVAKVLQEALVGKDQSDVEFSCIRKDKSTFRISVSWNHIFDKNGKALGIRTSGQDITSHRQAEEAVTQSEGLYRQMIDNAPFGMHFYQLNEKKQLIFTAANPAAIKILGVDHSQFFGLPIEKAFPSLVGTGVIQHYRDAALKNTSWVTDQIIYSDNRISGAYEVKAFQTMAGKMVAIFTDITKRKQAEAALDESRQLFEALTRVSPVGIFRTDNKGETTFVNPMWTYLTGLSYQDALESKYLTALHPDDREERVAEWSEAVKKGKTVISEYRFLRPDGSIVWVKGHAVPEIVENEIKGYIGTITDITELKTAEEEILKAKEKAEASNRLKTTFMGNISHEIRTPLNGIIGFAELISSGDNSKEENEECIDFLNHSINRLTKIIDNIMDVSMMMSGNITVKNETFSPDELANEVYRRFELQAARKNLEFKIENNGKSHEKLITCDKSLLTRIINELIDNAIKFTSKGGVNMAYSVGNNSCTLTITDSGAGISPEFLPFIFEPFVQEDVYSARVNNSNGLGLSIVHEAVTLLGGNVIAESRPGAGTTITVHLPVIESDLHSFSDYKPNMDTGSVKQPVILIVEDEEINMIYLKRLLSQKGYKLLLATNAHDAISFIKEGSSVDLILMDMKMPGMDGFEATRRIKNLTPDIKIAAVTAYASDADRESCIQAGCDEYISKPFQKNDLYQLLNRMNF